MEVEAAWSAWLGACGPDVPLDEALHRIAVEEGARGSLDAVQDALQSLADGVPDGPDPGARLVALLDHLFRVRGFRGDRETYDDPENSRIDRVLATRKGLPILLCAVAMEVGRRAGVPLVGIGFPGHFLVATADEPRVFADPFHGGAVRDPEVLRAELLARYGPLGPAQLAAALAPARPVDLLLRVSTNLMGAWSRRDRPADALRSADRRVALRPDLPELRRDRGLLAARVGPADLAADDLLTYLRDAPHASDGARVRWALAALQGLPGGGATGEA